MFIKQQKAENKVRQEEEGKIRKKEKKGTVILCWRLNKRAGRVEQDIPVYLLVLLGRATTALEDFFNLEECCWKFSSTPAALQVVTITFDSICFIAISDNKRKWQLL